MRKVKINPLRELLENKNCKWTLLDTVGSLRGHCSWKRQWSTTTCFQFVLCLFSDILFLWILIRPLKSPTSNVSVDKPHPQFFNLNFEKNGAAYTCMFTVILNSPFLLLRLRLFIWRKVALGKGWPAYLSNPGMSTFYTLSKKCCKLFTSEKKNCLNRKGCLCNDICKWLDSPVPISQPFKPTHYSHRVGHGVPSVNVIPLWYSQKDEKG